jgi:hypothetical protein
MATGVVYYWSGSVGWIKQTGVEDLPTVDARDVLVLLPDVSSGTVERDCTVSFTIDADRDPWLAREVSVT